jgi:hypothetical protein
MILENIIVPTAEYGLRLVRVAGQLHTRRVLAVVQIKYRTMDMKMQSSAAATPGTPRK